MTRRKGIWLLATVAATISLIALAISWAIIDSINTYYFPNQ